MAPASAEPTAVFTQVHPPEGRFVALTGATVIDVLSGKPIEHATVLIDSDRIAAVGPADQVEIPADAKRIDMSGQYLIPGLLNCHVHLGLKLPGAAGAALINESDADQVLRMAENARKSLYSGVTTVRLVGEEHGNDFALKRAIDGGRTIGPRIQSAGEIIAPTGGHGFLEADGPYGFAKAEREQIKAGATWIKLAISGGIADSHGAISAAPMTDEEMKVAIDVAHRNGVQITAHNGSSEAALQALKYGIDGFEHGYHFTDEVLRKMKAQGTWLTPTIVVDQPGVFEFFKKIGTPDWYLDRVRSTGKDHWRMLQDAIHIGVKISLGTDQLPYEPNSGTTATIHEAELYQKAGMSPLQALRAATDVPAHMLKLEHDVGAIAPGRYADIVALRKNPLDDIGALRTIDFVMKGGDVVRDDNAPSL
ncbi:amidohydrolase family protein [Solimonas sp. C16B3]|uniref:Amidohydrolase family protein n=2 Tax=Solimonas marina TaxID=2714601 RepID=A0A969W8J2_9GAMM|nr:amidohydrolase family protein [Solimonas marina]